MPSWEESIVNSLAEGLHWWVAGSTMEKDSQFFGVGLGVGAVGTMYFVGDWDVPEFVWCTGSFQDWFAEVFDLDCVCFCNGDFVRSEDGCTIVITGLADREERSLDSWYSVTFSGCWG